MRISSVQRLLCRRLRKHSKTEKVRISRSTSCFLRLFRLFSDGQSASTCFSFSSGFLTFRDEVLNKFKTEYIANVRKILERDCTAHQKTMECHQLAEFYQTIDRNHAAANELFTKLCNERSHAASCFQAGMQYVIGKGLVAILLLMQMLE